LIPINTIPMNPGIIQRQLDGGRIMIGVTLGSEQIRNAPPEIRRWIEREVCASLGLQASFSPAAEQHEAQLAACSAEEVAAILAQIQGVLPAVNVFFEFGRPGAAIGPSRVEAFRLLDIAHHTRLQNVNQVLACLEIINEALGRIRADQSARFCIFDRDGHCFIAQQTQQSILRLWQEVIANQQLAAKSAPPAAMPEGGVPPLDPAFNEMAGQSSTAAAFGEAAAVQP
jgi:hypothetical protein